MNIPEDRHPLLYVYPNDDQPERVRSRCISQGATTVLGKWPEHLTFSWMMAVTGLVSLLTCFLLAVVFLMVSSSGHHHGKRALIAKCERNDHVVQLVHMKNLEDLTVNENATYFVEIITDETKRQDVACSVESYLQHTSEPVFLVSIFTNNTSENLTILNELEKKFKNFNKIAFDLNSFFNKTVFDNYKNQNINFVTFLAKILVSWNVGGTVIDSHLVTLRNFQSLLATGDKILTVGHLNKNIVLISAKRFCHVYIFDILKTVIETNDILNHTNFDIIKTAQKRFCRGRQNCTGVKLLSAPEICDTSNITDSCIFLMPEKSITQFLISSNFSLENLCPLTKTLL